MVLALLWGACDSTGPASDEPTAPVTLSFIAGTGANAQANAAAKSQTITDAAGNALTIETVEIVLGEIEFERDDDRLQCGDVWDDDGDDGRDDDGCEEIERGPVLVALPLDSTQPRVVLEAAVPEGRFEGVEFDVHKLERDDPEDGAFLDETGFPAGVSIRVTGTWTPVGGTAQDFVYRSDLNEEQEIEFEPPIEVTAASPKNVTFVVNVDTWFRLDDGTLVNPDEGNDDGRYEDRIEENIEASIEGFEDDDRDGDDDNDDDRDDDD